LIVGVAATFLGLLTFPLRERASLAVGLIERLGGASWSENELAALADERDAELEKAL
jgi:hypothetical protein